MPANPRTPTAGGNGRPAATADDGQNGDRRPDDAHGRDARGHGGEEHAVSMDLPDVSRGAVVLIAAVVLVLFAALFLLGWIPHSRKQRAAKAEATEALAVRPVVDVMRPKRGPPTFDLVLPGDVQAMQSTALFARTNGYLKQPLVDIGDDVKAGQLLAEIDAPEVDAELEQAKATLQQAQVTVGRATNEFNFNKATFERYSGLAETGGVTAQQLDERRSAFNIANSSLKAAQANVAAGEAAVKRYTELKALQRIVAPFDGTITARNYDAGALVSATAGGSAGRELFRLAQTETLRAFVNVPQSYAGSIRRDGEAELLVRGQAGKVYQGKVARLAGAIDPATRTMRVEVHVPNADRAVLPGAYGQVRFKVRQDQPPLVVPTSALVFGPDGMRVATIAEGRTVRFKLVTIGRDFGNEAEILDGLGGGDQVVVNPGDRLVDGVEVDVAPPKGGPPAAPGAPAGRSRPRRRRRIEVTRVRHLVPSPPYAGERVRVRAERRASRHRRSRWNVAANLVFALSRLGKTTVGEHEVRPYGRCLTLGPSPPPSPPRTGEREGGPLRN